MPIRQEITSEKRSYHTTPRPVRGIPKYRSGSDWSQMPDYAKLPDYSLIGIAEVSILTGMSISVVERRVKDGNFAAPNYHGKDRVWSLGYVRQWCEQFAQKFEVGGSV